jgi:hypothetical protein
VNGYGADTISTTDSAADNIFRVRSYSGEANDDQVDVALYVGFGRAPRSDGSTNLRWDGTDAWLILPDTLESSADGGLGSDLDKPRYHDGRAYVTNGVLVAHFPQALSPSGLALAPSSLLLVNDVWIAGNIMQVGAQWELQHLVVGLRSPVHSLLPISSRLADGNNQPFCQVPAEYQSLKAQLCAFVDIASVPSPPTAPCDALSGGSIFEAKQAALGGIGMPAEGLPPCAAGIRPEMDSCSSP